MADDYSNSSQNWWSNDAAVVTNTMDSIWYTSIYTADPTNPSGLTDAMENESWYFGYDANEDGNQFNSFGGHIINPASLTLNYLDTNNNPVASPLTVTGVLAGTTNISDYLVKNVPVPAIVDTDYPTPAEQSALAAAFSAYYRLGQTVPYTAPAIAGYLAPANGSAVLANTATVANLTYTKQIFSIAFAGQANPAGVTSKLLTSSQLSIPSGNGCSTIQSASLLTGSSLPTNTVVPSTVTVMGGLQFSLLCGTGATTEVVYRLGQAVSAGSKLHVYKHSPTTNTVTDITGAVTITTDPSTHLPTITYQLVDGQAWDDDATTNGTIVDPIYIGVEGTLASTGENTLQLAAAALAVVACGVAMLVYAKKRSRVILKTRP